MMRITSITENNRKSSSTFIQHWARNSVHVLLEKIRIGCLILEEQGQVRHFGEDKSRASIVATIQVRDSSAFMQVLKHGSVGAGEAFMKGSWDTPDLIKVVRLMVLNMSMLEEMNNKRPQWQKLVLKAFHTMRKNTRNGSRKNIAAHYDLSNNFFMQFLDRSMAYSAGIFRNHEDTLEQASINKFQHICERLQLTAEDHLLEIGTGWGGLAIHAAKYFGCMVTTTTLSREQYDYAVQWVKQEGLEDKVTLLLSDYRELTGHYDKLVSIEMIEAVGAEFYADYFAKCTDLLKPDGLMLIQAITISDQRFEKSLNNVDFIKRYIFPGGQLPSNSVITDNIARHTDMQLIGMEDITYDYALTLKAWRESFWQNIEQIRSLGCDEVFIRMWHYYLCFCEGGFRERVIHTGQFLMARPAFRSLPPVLSQGSSAAY